MSIIDSNGHDFIWVFCIPILTCFIGTIAAGIYVDNRLKKNPYINSIKPYSNYIETFIDFKKGLWSSQSFSLFILFTGLVLGSLIEILILVLYLIIYPSISTTFPDHFSWLTVIFNTFIIIILGICLVWFFPIISRKMLCNDITNSCRFKNSHLKMFAILWLSLGIMYGAILTAWFLCYELESASNIIASSVIVSSNNNFFLACQHLLIPIESGKSKITFPIWIAANIPVTAFVFYCIGILSFRIKRFPQEHINPITKICQCNFPQVKIKTNSEEITGKLRDFQNKDLVILCEKNIVNIIPWEKIEKIEVCVDKKEPAIFYKDLINNKEL